MIDTVQKRKEFIVNTLFWALAVAIYYVIFRYAIGAAGPFVVAFIVTLLLKNPIQKLADKLKIRRGGAAAIVLILFYFLAAAVLVSIIFYVIWVMMNWFSTLPGLYASDIQPALVSILDWVESLLQKMDPSYLSFLDGLGDEILAKAASLVSSLSMYLLNGAQRIVFSLPGALIGILMTIIATIFMTLDYPKIEHFVLAQFNEERREIIHDIGFCLKDSLLDIIKSYAMIMLITFGELCLGLGISGIKNFVIISALIALFDILPVVGSAVILVPWAVIDLINGDWLTALKLGVLCIIITVVRNTIEPKIVGKELGLNAIVLLICMYLGTKIFGGIGLIILPFTVIVIKTLNDNGKIHVFVSDYLQEESEVKKYKAVLFDYDGTIMDTNQLIVNSWRCLAETAMPGREFAIGDLTKHFGKPLEEAVELTAQEYGIIGYTTEELCEIYRNYQAIHQEQRCIFPGVAEALAAIKAKGVKIGIVTSRTTDTTINGLESFGLLQYFDAIVASEDTDIHKPLPEPCLICCKKLGVEPADAVMVGDSRFDIACGNNAGADSAFVSWSFCTDPATLEGAEKPTYIINKAEELVDLV